MATLADLKTKRTAFKRRQTTLKNWLSTEGNNSTFDLLQTKLETHQRKFLEWEQDNAQLIDLDTENRQTNEEDADAIEGNYEALVAHIRGLLREKAPRPQIATAPPTGGYLNTNAALPIRYNIKLPEITLPKFDGKFESWHTFKDQFMARVGNNTHIQEVDKFQYLQSCLSSEAAQAIAAFDTTETNYKEAWAILERKFDNPRQALRRHCSLLLSTKRSKDGSKSLLELVNGVRQHMRSLATFGGSQEQLNGLIVTIILNNLDEELIFQWETTLLDNQMPSYEGLLSFLEKRGICAKTSETIKSTKPKESTTQKNSKGSSAGPQGNNNQLASSQQRTHTFTTTTIKNRKCPVCKAEHLIYGCPQFAEMNSTQRIKFINDNGRCLNCLAKNHDFKDCKSVVSLTSESGEEDILPTALIKIYNHRNEPITCRALIDTGSTKNFVTQDLAVQLGLPQRECAISIGTLNESPTLARQRIQTTIASQHSGLKKKLEFFIVSRICSLLPSEQIDRDLLSIPHNIQLADPEFHKPAPVQVLIGSGTALSILSVGHIKIPHTADVHLQKTLLGWIIAGHIVLESDVTSTYCHFTQMMDDFRKFWEIEDINSTDTSFSDNERACLDFFQRHVSRTPEGRYIVALPFTDRKDQLGSSKHHAKRQLLALERKFKSNPEFQRQYSEVIEEYLRLGHMQLVEDEQEEGFYLPHHGIIKETSQTTKLRVVFNASARSSTKLSLNDVLMVGPIQQDNIFILILRFRLFKYVFTGDIEKMYRQVLVRPEDRKFQRILWRINGIIRTLELLTVTFGVAPAPHLAISTLLQLADDEYESFPQAADALRKNTYVDDILAGADTLQEAVQLRDQLFGLLTAGGFNLRQCASNCPELLQDLPDRAINLQLLGGEDPTLKTLGVYWDSSSDNIVYTVNPITTRERITMRTIASDIARIYDPLGLVNPVITHAKIIQQELWRLQLDWDESVPEDIQTRWTEFIHQLPLLNEIQFNRRAVGEDHEQVELHGFCDASEKAYGACIYLRTTDQAGNFLTELLCAKSRITPLKGSYTIPRLELCAAELLIKLYTTIKDNLQLHLDKTVLWSDSTVVLHWIKTSPHLLQRFVANRVSRIQQYSEPSQWRHVRTYDNPADALSRGQLTTEFIRNPLWKHGPTWLLDSEMYWPQLIIEKPSNLPELKRVVCLETTVENSTLFNRFSSFERLRRFIAYYIRWKEKALISPKGSRRISFLTMAELDAAEINILRRIQQETFSKEVSKLSKGQPLPSNSRLLTLNPIIDSDGLIRVGGRINKATTLSFDERHPILLPKGHHVTQLIIHQVHHDNLHPGVQTTLHLIRRRYWLIDGRNQIRYFIRKCVPCSKVNPASIEYPMSALPKERLAYANPFTHTGVDYCGPLYIKEKRHRNRNKLKAWVCIFVCFSTKAIHIEVVSDISTEEFLAALSRFISRHPACQTLHSDNGTNFVGANNELKELYDFLNDSGNHESIARELLRRRITWSFIPPASPHCGGLWEAAVRSFKHHFRRVVGNELLTFQQLNTLCIKVEGILNSRPLTALSSDPNDYAALTPAHFLHGQSSNDLPAPDWTETPSNRLSYWQHIEKIKQHFWARWHKEYFNELNIRRKWMNGDHDLTIGTLVLVRDDNLPPLKWKMGRIIEVYPGSDNVIRKAKVRTASGIVDRNVRRLAPLPVDIDPLPKASSAS